MLLKELRESKGLTQMEASKLLNIPLRTYSRYENDETRIGTLKYEYMINKLNEYNKIDENNGLLKINEITDICKEVFSKYEVEYCYLFGSYARGEAQPNSDVDLLVSIKIDGLKFYSLVEELREKLHKKVDLLDQTQLENNYELTLNILKDGIKIYEKQ